MRERRFELAAWEVFECGKPWREADADVAEAIDFCEFYAREMLRLAEPRRRDVPGETNATRAHPARRRRRHPPLELPAGDPLRHDRRRARHRQHGHPEAGRAVARSSPGTWPASCIEAGLPPGVLELPPRPRRGGRPGAGQPPRTSTSIAFTGSRDVGLLINRQAADTPPGQDHVKRVIAEMGGKNAIIVDDDADLDEAVVGVVQSAFGYAGQKCSACSRAIVLEGIYDAFLARLVEAGQRAQGRPGRRPRDRSSARSSTPTPATASSTTGRSPRQEGRVVLDADVGRARRARATSSARRSSPTSRRTPASPRRRSSARCWPSSRPATWTTPCAIANGTPYALTGGLYSRSPAHIDRVKREFRVGNLYINRGITGALVDRQPFGGFKLSGIGTKAGGPDYLLEFLLSREHHREHHAPRVRAGGPQRGGNDGPERDRKP